MATLLQTYNGNTAKNASQTNQHYVRARLYLDSNTGSGYTMHWVWDVYLIKWTAGVGRTFTYKYGGTSTTFDQSYKSVSNVAVQTKTGGSFTVAYGSSCSTTAQAVWYTDGGTAQNSTLSVSYTVPRPTYTISYNANGGTGAPTSQSKTYGTNITLSTVVPTREAYIFKGWSTSSTATTATYQPGGTFSTNANTVLYAVWSLIKTNSKITSMKLKRCLQDGTEDNEGTYCKITVNYAADVSQDADNTIVRLKWSFSNDESGIININQAEGSNVIINQNELSLEENCSAIVLITDEYTDDGSETFEEYSDLQKRLVYALSLLKRPKLYIKNWYNTKVSEYGDSLIEFPDELSSALGSDKLYANTIQNDEEIFNNYTLNLTSDNIAESTFNDLIIEGQSVQDGTPAPDAPVPIVSVESRNLLPVYSATTVNGITFTVDGSGAVTANGTASATVNHYVLLTVPETGAYVMSGCPAGGSASTYQLWTYDTTTPRDQQLTDTGSGATGTLTEGHLISVRIRIQSGYTATDLTFRPMLERGTTAHQYQPYGCVTLVAQSRNLLDMARSYRQLPWTSEGVTFSDNGDGGIRVSGTASTGVAQFLFATQVYNQLLQVGETYTLGGITTPGVLFNTWKTGGSDVDSDTSVTMQVPDTNSWNFKLRVLKGTTVDGVVYPQIELGSTATAYTPYVNTRTDIDLQGHALRSLPDGTEDELSVDSLGRVTMTQRVGSVTLDGSENWSIQNDGKRAHVYCTEGGAFWDMRPYSASVMAPIYCDYFPARTANSTWRGELGVSIEASTDRKAVDMSDGTGTMDLNAWKTWLAAHPTTLVYPLATPQTIDLGTIELPVISENNVISIDALVSPTLNISYNENIVYADELNDLFIYLYNAGEWNDNSDPLTGTSSAHIIDIAHSALSGFYFAVPDGTVIQRIEKLYTYNGGSFTDSVTNELWNITSEGNIVSDEILILQGGNA